MNTDKPQTETNTVLAAGHARTKPIVKTIYLVCIEVPQNEHNDITPDRAFVYERDADEFIVRNPQYGKWPIPLVEW